MLFTGVMSTRRPLQIALLEKDIAALEEALAKVEKERDAIEDELRSTRANLAKSEVDCQTLLSKLGAQVEEGERQRLRLREVSPANLPQNRQLP